MYCKTLKLDTIQRDERKFRINSRIRML